MSVRKRQWTTRKGEQKEAWIVDYAVNGSRHIETFGRKKDADARRFSTLPLLAKSGLPPYL
jgi:hypothetical protein